MKRPQAAGESAYERRRVVGSDFQTDGREAMERETRRFEAEGPDGRRFVIIELQRLIDYRPINKSAQRLGGQRRLALLEGGHVNDLGNGSFEIFDTGEIVRRAP